MNFIPSLISSIHNSINLAGSHSNKPGNIWGLLIYNKMASSPNQNYSCSSNNLPPTTTQTTTLTTIWTTHTQIWTTPQTTTQDRSHTTGNSHHMGSRSTANLITFNLSQGRGKANTKAIPHTFQTNSLNPQCTIQAITNPTISIILINDYSPVYFEFPFIYGYRLLWLFFW